MTKSGIRDPRLPNSGKAVAPGNIKALLSDAKKKADEIMHEKREAFNRNASPVLRDQYNRLKEIYDKKMSCIQARLDERKDRGSRLAKDWEQREKDRAKRDFDNYIRWVEDHMTTTDGAYVQLVAVFTGEA